MKLVTPDMIAKIDRFAIDVLGIPEETLIRRAGDTIVETLFREGIYTDNETYPKTVILAGGGNNGADGYAAALALRERGVLAYVLDVFGKGQRSEGGKAVLAEYRQKIGEPLSFADLPSLADAGVYIDAMFGTGFSGDLPEEGRVVARYLNRREARIVAVDIPFGVNAYDGSADADALSADITVVLSYMKKGLLSYPAKEKCGKLVPGDIGLDIPAVHDAFPTMEEMCDDSYVRKHLPGRRADSHKGSFGKAVLFCGSKKYRGAASLATLAALRGGVGLLTLVSEREVLLSMSKKLPEAIYRECAPIAQASETLCEEALEITKGASAVLIGPGCGVSEGLYRLILALLACEGCPLILDADAFTALAMHREEAEKALCCAKREVLMTPHPLEFSRLAGVSVAEIQAHRMEYARFYAEKWNASVLLKGAGTVIATPSAVRVNTTGSSALAKGGSGDVLAGLVTALAAQGASPLHALELGAYLHGKAGDTLAFELSEYGVLPSDLPKQIASEISKIQKSK